MTKSEKMFIKLAKKSKFVHLKESLTGEKINKLHSLLKQHNQELGKEVKKLKASDNPSTKFNRLEVLMDRTDKLRNLSQDVLTKTI